MTTTFADLGVPAPMCRVLADHGIAEPFPIQSATLPDALAGRDLCGRAPTGSGKTIAFGIPLIAHVKPAEPRRPRGLVLVPTRELAAQVREELVMLAGPRGARVEAFYGGNGFDRQLKALRRGVDIAVACPGRLADLIGRGDIRLDSVEVVVIDEADRMADMGFLPEVKRLLDQVPSDRQTLLFSATLDGAVDELIRRYQHDPARHRARRRSARRRPVEHLFWQVLARPAHRALRQGRIARSARPSSSAAPSGAPTGWPASSRRPACAPRPSTATGRRASANVRSPRSSVGQVEALVATDVAARGIHVDDVAGVVHLDPPADEKDYIHRSGRTGRAGGQGVVISFVAPEQRRDVAKMQRTLGLATGLTSPDATGLPQIDRPAPRPRPRPRPETSAPAARRSPRPSGGPARSRPPAAGSRRAKPASAGGASSTRSGPSRSGPSLARVRRLVRVRRPARARLARVRRLVRGVPPRARPPTIARLVVPTSSPAQAAPRPAPAARAPHPRWAQALGLRRGQGSAAAAVRFAAALINARARRCARRVP